MIEAILHKASTNLNSLGSLYRSLRFRQYQFANRKGKAVRTPAMNTPQFHRCRTRVIAHWIAINPDPTTNRSSFSFAKMSAVIATAAHLIAKYRSPGENADPTAKME